MTVKFEPFSISDLPLLDVQPRHKHILPIVYRNILSLAPQLSGPWSWTAWSVYGVPIAAAGVLKNGFAWALLGQDLRRNMVAVHRAVGSVLEQRSDIGLPTYATIDPEYRAAVRWAKALGFRPASSAGVWVFQ